MSDHVNGLDVSGWNNKVQWPRVHAAGFTFAWMKATESVNFADELFQANINYARQSMMIAGAYHFMSWLTDAEQQAQWFLQHYKPLWGDLPPALDCEGACPLTAPNAINSISRWLHIVDKAIYPQRCAIYMSPSWWEANLNRTQAFAGHPLWAAQWKVNAPDAFGAWKPTFWQKADNLQVDGITGNVDWDWFLGTEAQLKGYLLK